MIARIILSLVWSLTFVVAFSVVYLGFVVSVRFSQNAASASIVVPMWIFWVAAAIALVGFSLGITGRLPGTRSK